ncbi:pyruvate, water dikinase, partial [Candidatus Woesebacteria bacterium RIFCSPHIGHO2_12_FULL_44_11]
MAAAQPFIVDFRKIDKNDIPLVGGKGANLGEMANAGFPVPTGFAITVHAYDLFLRENDLAEKLAAIQKDTNKEDPESFQRASKKIEELLKGSKIPDIVGEEVIKYYRKLSGFKKALVAVRSSATAEDLPTASFAGQQATFLNVQGEASLLHRVRDCWASLFTARAIFYRQENKIDHAKVKISVIVQKMIQSEASGVMFTIDPVTNDKDKIIIEAVWGLGELIVQGSVVPDKYIVQKDTFFILSKQFADQAIQLVRAGFEIKETAVPKKLASKRKLSDEEIVKLAKIGERLQQHYYFPQDIEWAKEGKNLYIVQTRPVTTTSIKYKVLSIKGEDVEAASAPILTGIPASPGVASGHVKITKSPKEIGKVENGDVLVAEMTSPDYVPAMKKASAIVTNKGGMTSHAAIVSRELGIPAIVGAKEATTKLKEGWVVTVDASRGQVYLGSKIKVEKVKKVSQVAQVTKKLKTATNLYVNLAEPELAAKIAKKHVDGVGLLRAEFMIANIGMHPKEAIKQKKQLKYIDSLASNLEKFTRAFDGRPVVYRATDFKTNEYRSLPGGKAWEPQEPNPMLGFRGAYRYKANPDVFNLELAAIKKVRESYDNLHLMIPFVRSPQELADIRRIVAGEDFFKSTTFKFWMMVELPVNVIALKDFIEVGIDGVSVGSNDLTMLLLGTDRDNAEVADAFNERSPVVYWALRRVIRTCHKYGITASICGQAPSVYE